MNQVIAGIKKCSEINKIPETVAIDTWGVDYVLIDANGNEILPAVSYRDNRTDSVQEEVGKILSQKDLYVRTGIQKQNFNTLYQLYCDKKSGKLKKAKYFLMIPDYLAYKLTDKVTNEYTNATTTNLVNAAAKDWDNEIIEKLGLPRSIFLDLSLPKTEMGCFNEKPKRRQALTQKLFARPATIPQAPFVPVL